MSLTAVCPDEDDGRGKGREAQRQQEPQRDRAGEKAHEGIEEVQDL